MADDRHLAVADLAKGARVLPCDADRVTAFLPKTGVIQEQDTVALALALEQALDARAVQVRFIPGQIGQQIMQPLRMRSRDYARQGVTIFVWVLVEQPGHVAFQSLGALALPKLHLKGGQKVLDRRQRRSWSLRKMLIEVKLFSHASIRHFGKAVYGPNQRKREDH
jgi:hypothetical protein